MFGMCLTGTIGKVESVFIKTDTEPVYSLERESTIEGKFTLGSGSFGSSICYYVYLIDEENGYKVLASIPAVGTAINETDEIAPSFEVRQYKYKANFRNCFHHKHSVRVLNIPKDSIRINYEM